MGFPDLHLCSFAPGGASGKEPPCQCRIRSLDWEDPLEEGTATHSSIFAWKIPMDRGAWRALTVRREWRDLAQHTRGRLNCRLMWLFWLLGVPCHSTCMLGSACVLLPTGLERVTGRKAGGLQTEGIGCKCQTFLISLLRGRRKETSVAIFLHLHTNLKGFSENSVLPWRLLAAPEFNFSQTLS